MTINYKEYYSKLEKLYDELPSINYYYKNINDVDYRDEKIYSNFYICSNNETYYLLHIKEEKTNIYNVTHIQLNNLMELYDVFNLMDISNNINLTDFNLFNNLFPTYNGEIKGIDFLLEVKLKNGETGYILNNRLFDKKGREIND